MKKNVEKEYERNSERYALLKWAQRSFDNFRVVPPNSGICHQVNLDYLGRVVITEETDGGFIAYPDTLVGTDSHTTMINGIGVMGWGVGGIEAEAVINAEIKAGTFIVEGEVNGNVSANVKVEILSTGKLYGKIDTPALVIEAGRFFEGNCKMVKTAGRVAAEKVTPIKEQEVELFQDEDQQNYTDHPQIQT